MKLKKFLALVVLMLFFSSCSGGASVNDDEVVLDSFEGEISKQTVDYGSSADTFLEVTAAKDIKFCGDQSLKLDYELNEGGYMFCARGYGLDVLNALWEAPTPGEIAWHKYTGISLQVYGSDRGDIAFDVKDSGGEIWRFIINDDFQGWKEITVPLSSFQVRTDWQPGTADGNKTLDFPVKSFQFEPRTPGKGTVYFDCVKLIR